MSVRPDPVRNLEIESLQEIEPSPEPVRAKNFFFTRKVHKAHNLIPLSAQCLKRNAVSIRTEMQAGVPAA